MQDRVLHLGRDLALIRRLPVRHHHPDFSAEVFLVETERLGALTREIHVRVQFHDSSPA